jgi:hypothetical protein
VVTLSVGAIALLFIGTPAADAAPAAPTQAVCDPTGEVCLPDSPPPIEPRCSLSSNTVAAGATLVAHLENVRPGTAATLTFDGTPVGSGTATAQNRATTGSLDVSFAVPPGGGTEPHHVVFSGAGFQCIASPDLAVSGSAAASPGGPGSSPSHKGSNVGLVIAAIVALALAILAALQFRRVARQRRLAAEATRNPFAHQYVR